MLCSPSLRVGRLGKADVTSGTCSRVPWTDLVHDGDEEKRFNANIVAGNPCYKTHM